MKIIAVIEADFATGALGTRSRLNDDLLGETVVRRTLKRVLAAARIASVHLVTDVKQEALCREAASGLNVRVETHDAGPAPWMGAIASSRKWSLDSWRGGLGGSTVFDESLHPWLLEALARRENADGVAAIPAAAVLLDPILLDRMIEHFEQVREEVRLVFTQSAPGLSAAIYMPAFLADLANAGQPLARVMAYRPSEPLRDMVVQSCFYPSDAGVAHAVGRCVADTQAGFDRVAAILRECGDRVDVGTVSAWLCEHRHDRIDALPAEVEIELTTDDPLPQTALRPRGQPVEQREPMDVGLFSKLIGELAQRDDIRVVLGGFGDPLMHPEWPRLLRICREAQVFGLTVCTPAVHLDERAIAALVEAKADVLHVLLDAHSADTYRRVHRADHFQRVVDNVERLLKMQHSGQCSQPLVVCEMMKTRESMGELEAFYDHWMNKTGTAVIRGPSAHGGNWADLSVMRMAPPTRFACGRIFNRAMVLADGRVTACDQDFSGNESIGIADRIVESDLEQCEDKCDSAVASRSAV